MNPTLQRSLRVYQATLGDHQRSRRLGVRLLQPLLVFCIHRIILPTTSAAKVRSVLLTTYPPEHSCSSGTSSRKHSLLSGSLFASGQQQRKQRANHPPAAFFGPTNKTLKTADIGRKYRAEIHTNSTADDSHTTGERATMSGSSSSQSQSAAQSAVSAEWDAVASDWDSMASGYRDSFVEVLRERTGGLLRPGGGEIGDETKGDGCGGGDGDGDGGRPTIVDFGCGTGLLAEVLRHEAREVVCIDASPAMIEKLKEKMKDEKWDNVRAYGVAIGDRAVRGGNGDGGIGAVLDELRGRVDLVVASSVFGFVPEQDLPETMRVLGELLRPGGKGILCHSDWPLSDEHPGGFTDSRAEEVYKMAGLEARSMTEIGIGMGESKEARVFVGVAATPSWTQNP